MELILVENPVLFFGRVEAASDLPIARERTQTSPMPIGKVARFQVLEAFRGIGEERVRVAVYTGQGGGDCGVLFKEAASYLVAGKLVPLGGVYVLYTDSCTAAEAEDTPALRNNVRETVRRLPPLDQATEIGDRVTEGGVHN